MLANLGQLCELWVLTPVGLAVLALSQASRQFLWEHLDPTTVSGSRCLAASGVGTAWVGVYEPSAGTITALLGVLITAMLLGTLPPDERWSIVVPPDFAAARWLRAFAFALVGALLLYAMSS